MVPVDFTNFFSVMAGVGATLFGLIFLVITIKPEVTSPENISVMRQVQVASSYSALLNPLIISLFALVPHATIGVVTLTMSIIGLVNTIIMGTSLLRDSRSWRKKLTSFVFIYSSLVIFGFEIFYGIRLIIAPGDLSVLFDLTTLLVVIYLYGIARAWDLVGARQFHINEVVSPLISKKVEGIISNTFHTESGQDANKQGD